ncbi:MAG: 50S ribosomal protein L25 [Endomicrobium sp.]|jgi:large subunit ribosomal protein L25|nr:50S ribosomal protein L25 [Endomicrobium sp.]
MSKLTLNAELRKKIDNLSLLRQKGYIPAIVYGKNITSQSIYIDSKLFNLILQHNGDNAIIDLYIQKSVITVIIKALQRDIITHKVIHVDFHIVVLEHLIEVSIPIHTEGIAVGVKNFGGILDFVLREVKVKTFPNNIPQKIVVNISDLQIGQGITVADLPHIKGVEYLDNPSKLLLHVISPSIINDTNMQNESVSNESIEKEVKPN